MRNLKRVLSLALALVMVLGLMIVGASAASADFADASEIKYTEAVDVLTGLGILEGNDKGSFDPTGILTREQAAKIICYIIMGAENAEKLGNNTQIFDDVAAGRWSAGYIAYCANLGIIAGYGNGNFGPEDQLTGVAFGKLLLVAAGYNAETQGYVGNDWATNIATDMIANDIDVAGVVLSDPLTREQAAQMVLQALDMGTVTYTTGNVIGMIGPFPAEETFAEKYFPKLEKISGVITANEYADLYGAKPLAAGKTEIDGVPYKGTTALTDIGESRVGWANDGKILYLADSGKNTVFETGAATDISTTAKFKKVTGLTDSAEYFLNFGGEYTVWTCEYLLTYGIGDNETVVKAGKAIDIDDLKEVFDDNDGYVYLGTSNTDNEEDYSSTMSWSKFKAAYLDGSVKTDAINTTENGEWLKVIDNDGDGKADYVFKTTFTMSVVTAISKKGEITIPNIVTDSKKAGYNADEIVALDELAVDDVVIYTIIDGVAYVELADSFEATVQKYSYKTETMTTTDGEDYQQSGIANLTDYVYDDLEDLDDTDYIFYVDHFGYIRVAALPADGADNYVLLTEFYNTGSNKDNLISTKTLIAETVTVEEEVEEYEVATKLGDLEDDGLVDDTNDNNVGSVAGTESWTNVAAYGMKDDAITLATAYNKVVSAQGKLKAETDYIALVTDEITKGQKHFDIAETDVYGTTQAPHGGEYINVTQNTVIFYVLGTAANEIEAVDVVVGYSNIVPVEKINAVYAVADRTKIDTETNADYWTAKILVIEAEDYAVSYKDSLTFVYSNPEKETSKVFSLESIAADGTAPDTLYVKNDFSNGQYVSDTVNALAFYAAYENKDGYDVLDYEITEDFEDWNIFAAEFKRVREGSKMDYIDIIADGKVKAVPMPNSETAYTLSTASGNTYDIDTVDMSDREEKGDKIIYVTNKDGEIIYLIDVSTSFTGVKETAAQETLVALWNEIANPGAAAAAAALDEYVTDAKAALDEAVEGYEDDAAVKAAYDAEIAALDALTEVPEEAYVVPEAVTDAVAAAVAAKETAALKAAVEAAVKTVQTVEATAGNVDAVNTAIAAAAKAAIGKDAAATAAVVGEYNPIAVGGQRTVTAVVTVTAPVETVVTVTVLVKVAVSEA